MGRYEKIVSRCSIWGVDILILVTLGTQDKGFERLLKQVEAEIEKKNITEKVVVQAGHTKYKSDKMEIFDFVSSQELEKLVDSSRIIITHGGVGSILMGLKKNKIVIAAPRLKKYREHTNDHQKQIVSEFSKRGYILELKDFSKLGKLLLKADTFRPKKFVSNTPNFVNNIENYIEEDNHTSWYNKIKEILWYGFFGVLTTVINIISFYFLDKLGLNTYLSNFIAWFFSVLFAFITNKFFVFNSKFSSMASFFKEMFSFFLFRILSLGIDMGGLFVLLDVFKLKKIIAKVVVNIIVIIVNYIFSKLFVFKGKSN